jgi:hypothetical protein
MSRRTTLGPISQSALNSRASLLPSQHAHTGSSKLAANIDVVKPGRLSMAPSIPIHVVQAEAANAGAGVGVGRQSMGVTMNAGAGAGARRASVGVPVPR